MDVGGCDFILAEREWVWVGVNLFTSSWRVWVGVTFLCLDVGEFDFFSAGFGRRWVSGNLF